MKYSEDQLIIISKIASLFDVIQMLLMELKPVLRQQYKKLANDALKSLEKFIKGIDKILPQEQQEEFGKQADELKEIIDKL